MRRLQRLWLALEDVAGMEAVRAEWCRKLGSDFEVATPLLQPTDRYADSYPVAGDPRSCYRVVAHGPDDIVGVDDGGRPTISLTKQEVLIYRMDPQRVGRRAAAAFGFAVADAPVDDVPHTLRIGTFRPFAGFAFPVFLVIPLEAADLLRAVEAISSRSDGPFIVIAPTARRMRPACESLLHRQRACFLALAETIAVDRADKWTVTPEATQRLAAFRQMVVPQAEGSDGHRFFPTPVSATWSDVRIKFVDGEAVSVKVGDVAARLLYSEMGMVDGRTKKPNKQWELLRSFGKRYGVMTWESPDADRRNQKRREYLAHELKAFFRIDGEPIVLTDDKKGWRTVFSIESDS